MRAWSLLVVLVIAGCGKPHVRIPALPAQLPPEQRVAAFQHYRQGGEGLEIVSNCGLGGCKSTKTDLLLLSDGSEIRYAEDLLPLLPADGAAAAAARDVDAARRKQKRWETIGGLMFVGCFIASMIAFDKENDPIMVLGLAGTVGGLLVWGGSELVFRGEINEKTRIVFDGYDQHLATRLNVCVNGITVVPCEQTGGAPPAAAEPDPALRDLRQK